MKTVCVYLGAQFGNDNEYSDAAILLGKKIAADGFTLVYGGSSLGMMGLLVVTIKKNDWKQVEAAQHCGITQPRLNDMLRGRISRFSLDALVNIAAAIGQRVHI